MTVRRFMLYALPAMAVMALAAVFAGRLATLEDGTDVPPSARLNQSMPAIRLDSLYPGEPGFDTEALRGGPYVLNVWAEWCGPCKIEHPSCSPSLGRESRSTESTTRIARNAPGRFSPNGGIRFARSAPIRTARRESNWGSSAFPRPLSWTGTGSSGIGMPGGDRPIATIVWCAVLVALVAVAWPIDTTPTRRAASTPLVDPDVLPAVPGSEDLTAFRNSQRWGGASFNQVAAEAAAAKAAGGEGANRDNVGLVGLVASPTSRVALLVEGEGTVTRRAPGEALPDGRVLTEVAANTATLTPVSGNASNAETQPPSAPETSGDDVLVLFPHVNPTPLEPPASGDATESQGPPTSASR